MDYGFSRDLAASNLRSLLNNNVDYQLAMAGGDKDAYNRAVAGAMQQLHGQMAQQGMNAQEWDAGDIFNRATGANLGTAMHAPEMLSQPSDNLENALLRGERSDYFDPLQGDINTRLLKMYGFNPQQQLPSGPNSFWGQASQAMQGAGNTALQASGAPSLWQLASGFMNNTATPWLQNLQAGNAGGSAGFAPSPVPGMAGGGGSVPYSATFQGSTPPYATNGQPMVMPFQQSPGSMSGPGGHPLRTPNSSRQM